MDQCYPNIPSNIHHAHVRKYKSTIAHVLEPLETFSNKYIKKKDSNYCIEKLSELIADPISRENKLWIDRLLNRFLLEVPINSYKVKHLPAIMTILEFLATKIQDIPEYKKYLNIMLDICAYPPLLEKSSEYLSCSDIIVHYFTVLGYLLVLIPNNQEIIKTLDIINKLLIRSTPVEISAIKLEFVHSAVEKSRLPLILSDLIQISSSEIFKDILDTTFNVASISNMCCHRMLGAGIFNYLICRFADSTSMNKLDENLLKTHVHDEIIVLTNCLWLLLKSIFPPQTLPLYLKNLPAPDNNAMSKRSKKFLMMRNDLAAIILGGIVALPSWRLVNCGIAEDIIAAAVVAVESEETELTNNDFIFIKTLFSILCYFSESGGLLSIMKESDLIVKMMINLKYEKLDGEIMNKSDQLSQLMSYKLRTLTILVPKMPEEFVKHRGSTKLLTIFDCCTSIEPLNTRDTLEIVKTICSIVSSKSSILLKDFREAGAIPIIYRFIERTQIFYQFLKAHQRILTFLVIIMELIMLKETELIENYKDQTIIILLKIMERCRHNENFNCSIDDRLLIAIGSYIGECIVWYPTISKKFIISNGLYIMLDIIEKASLFVRNVYFKSLVDLCTTPESIPYVCTWRDGNKKKGFMSLLAKCWREEEVKLNVKRTREGCIEDVELPLMEQAQWNSNFHTKSNHDFSPTIVSMIGSIRPKIYSIRKILLTNSELCDKSKEHYRILLEDLPVEDAITFCIIDQFFRFAQGQVWLEVLDYLQQVGVSPLGTDGQMLLVMNQRHRRCAVYVQDRQEKILSDAKRKELVEEQKEFIRIRDATLASALTAAKELDYIRRTTDENYRLRRKKEQINQINKALSFPTDANIDQCHRTFNDNWNITPISNQSHSMRKNFSNSKEKNIILPPISPLTNSAPSLDNDE
ncbi:hypothetical protein PV327_004576 [Microctonus hyperodae]|uniref:Cilia- and flagella-associated protein 69 ARM repeats domain-containing protein n=1 Tax=Microctonus hyperodae TaxID=165561 RepID=A0AA39KMP2_MICHY|nr:hypothetical protein PV327_004576 [Microctonus hyperodae]